MPGKRARRAVRSLVAASAVTLVAFAVMVAYAAIALVQSGRLAVAAITNGLPSSERLVEARSDLRALNGAMDAALLDKMAGRPLDARAVNEARDGLRRHLAAYEALPAYPGERARGAALTTGLAGVDQATRTMISLLGAGTLAEAHTFENGAWRRATDEFDDDLQAMILFNMSHLEEHLQGVRRIAEEAFLVLLLAGVLSLALAVLSTASAVRSIRRDERRLEERAAEWEMFSARAAHDLLAPLQTVSLGLSLSARTSPDERTVRAAGLGLTALARMKTTAEALLEFARSGGRPVEDARAEAHRVIPELLEELRPEAADKGVELAHEALPELVVACPPGILSVILANLVRNAVKFMGERPTRRVTVSLVAEGHQARFEVRDTGPGLPAGLADPLFQPFARGPTAAGPGFGLGLATVKRLVEAYGGQVGAQTNPPGGSIFWFQLPLAQGRPSSLEPA